MRSDTGVLLTGTTERDMIPGRACFFAAIPAPVPDLTYYYDGTWEGWLCCICESYMAKEIPGTVIAKTDGDTGAEGTLFYKKVIETRPDLAERVQRGICDRIGFGFLQILKRAFCSCMPHKEEQMLLFTHKGFRYGMSILHLRQDTVVNSILKGLRELGREIDKWLGFVRFSDVRGILVAVIGAKNNVLPFMASHFCDRYRNEHFMIFDRNHKIALLYRPGEKAIVPMDGFSISEISAEEKYYRSLWKNYYDAVEIRPRHNEICRRSHMPKRYWDFLTEMTEPGDCTAEHKVIQ